MYIRIKNSLSKPSLVFFYIKDSFLRVFSYLLLLTLIMSIPVVVISITSPESFFPASNTIRTELNKEFINEGVNVVDQKLVLENSAISLSATVDGYLYVVGKIPAASAGYVVSFEELKVVLYASMGGQVNVPINEVKYSKDFSFDDEGISEMMDIIKTLTVNNKTILFSQLFSNILLNLFELVMYALILAVIAKLIRRLPLRFSAHFKIAVYSLTSYVFLKTVLTLFGLGYIADFTIIIAAIYNNFSYASIRMIRRPGVKEQDEEK